MLTKEQLLEMYVQESQDRALDEKRAPYMWEFLEEVMMAQTSGIPNEVLMYMLKLVYTEETIEDILVSWDRGESYGGQ